MAGQRKFLKGQKEAGHLMAGQSKVFVVSAAASVGSGRSPLATLALFQKVVGCGAKPHGLIP